MNSNPYALPAFIVCVAALFGCAAWAFLAIFRQPATGHHARRRDPGDEARQFATELRAGAGRPERPGPREPDPLDDRWWDVKPPPEPVLAEPVLPVRQPRPVPDVPRQGGVPWMLLGRVRDALLPDAWRPEPGEVTFTPADPDATMTDLPAVTSAPQYLAAPQ